GPPDAPHPGIGRCDYDADNLQRMKKADLLGLGYTVVAHWQGYRPDITRIKIQICFVPEQGGSPLYGEPVTLSLNGGGQLVVTQPSTTVSVHPSAAPMSDLPAPARIVDPEVKTTIKLGPVPGRAGEADKNAPPSVALPSGRLGP